MCDSCDEKRIEREMRAMQSAQLNALPKRKKKYAQVKKELEKEQEQQEKEQQESSAKLDQQSRCCD